MTVHNGCTTLWSYMLTCMNVYRRVCKGKHMLHVHSGKRYKSDTLWFSVSVMLYCVRGTQHFCSCVVDNMTARTCLLQRPSSSHGRECNPEPTPNTSHLAPPLLYIILIFLLCLVNSMSILHYFYCYVLYFIADGAWLFMDYYLCLFSLILVNNRCLLCHLT